MSNDCCSSSDAPTNVTSSAVPVTSSVGAGVVRTPMRIVQMDCPTEEALIRKRLQGMAEVVDVQFNLMQRILTVDYQQGGLETVLAALRAIGFTPELPNDQGEWSHREVAESTSTRWWPLVVAGIFAVVAEGLYWFGAPAWLSFLCAVVAIGCSGLETYKKGWTAVMSANLNINALMSIAVTGAVLIGQWPEAAMVMVLFAVAEAIEARSLDHARQSVERLMEVAPDQVTMQTVQGQWESVAANAVVPGAQIRVRPGERIGLDGVIIAGQSDVNQAPITGESLPQAKQVGDTVFAGTINGGGELHVEVTADANDTMLARIIHIVHEAQARKAPTQRFVDRFAQVYTPIVVLLALGAALLPPLVAGMPWYNAIYNALVLLVIACPCALVISTPVAVVSALGVAARHGVLVKGGAYLEMGRQLDWLAVDKTGTLTTGRPTLLEVLQAQDTIISREQGKIIAAALASRSTHPVSQAIYQGLASAVTFDALNRIQLQEFTEISGSGTQATIAGTTYYLGRVQWLVQEVGIELSPAFRHALNTHQQQGKTITVLACDAGIIIGFVVTDTLRKSSVQAIQALHELGVKTLILSGDHPDTVRTLGQQAGIDVVYGGLLPQQKLEHIEALVRQSKAGMLGDGINDAPALARADIGFAMGVSGSDAAIETADVALMDDDLMRVPWFINLSRRTYRILVQNIAVAIGLKAVFIGLTLAGMATMWMAVFADVGASLLVIINSLRLLRP